KNVQITTPGSANIRVVNNTFVDDAALGNTGKTVGVQAAGTGAMSAVFANNFFSGIAAPIDVTLKDNKTAILDHNVFTGNFNLQGMKDSGAFEASGRTPSADIWADGYAANLGTALAIPIECSVINACNPLYAGSSTAGYATITDKDVFGKARSNKHEVGAFELAGSASNVIGLLSISASPIDSDFTRIPWVVTAKTFDLTEADSVFVYWGTSDLGTPTDARLAAVPAIRQKHFPATDLGSGTLSDVATQIAEENTNHIFAVVLVRKDSGSGSKLYGHPYTDTVKSGVNVNPGDCEIKAATSACPSGAGQFIVKEGPYADAFTTRVNFSEAVTTGLVKNPEFLKIDQASQVNLDLRSSLPMIRLYVTVPGLGEAGSKQTFKADIEVTGTIDLTGLSLFQIPDDSTKDMARFVPTWSYRVEGGKTYITIESNVSGRQNYAFGKLLAGMVPGDIVSTAATAPLFDFTQNDSAVVHVPIKFKGEGFKTSNPLVLISVIPAGGIIKGTGGNVGDVISPAYHSKTLVLSSGYSNLADTLRKDRIYRYFKRAAGFEPVSAMAMGHKKPFLLDSTISFDNFVASTEIQAGDVAVSTGAMGEIQLNFPVGRNFKDFDKYADQTGKASRSIEIEYTVFDGEKISRSRSFIRTKFSDGELHISEKKKDGYARSTPGAPKWNLIGYPWDEADTGSLARIFTTRLKWDNDYMRLMRYKGSGKGAGSFTIYDGSNNSAIKFDSGMASWSGSTSPYTPSSVTGMSLDFESFR
ncbi:MAG: hypothetical protein ABIW76_17090, partial [Fibrobacteria bacterium]